MLTSVFYLDKFQCWFETFTSSLVRKIPSFHDSGLSRFAINSTKWESYLLHYRRQDYSECVVMCKNSVLLPNSEVPNWNWRLLNTMDADKPLFLTSPYSTSGGITIMWYFFFTFHYHTLNDMSFLLFCSKAAQPTMIYLHVIWYFYDFLPPILSWYIFKQ